MRLRLLYQSADEGSLSDLSYAEPVFFFNAQTTLDEFTQLRRDICSERWGLKYFFTEFVLGSTTLQGCSAMQELIDEDTKRPNISLRSIDMMYKSFGTHVERTANADIFEALCGFYGKAEISKFVLSVCDEDIG